MNKAFIKEPDDTGQRHCPRCGSLGTAVQLETLQAHLTPEALRNLSDAAYFCPYPRCDVVYFDAFDRQATTDVLLHGVYPKDREAPMCGCFGLTEEDVEQDIREGGATRVRELLAKAKSPDARCTVRSASGQCCVPEVQRYFMKLRGASATDTG